MALPKKYYHQLYNDRWIAELVFPGLEDGFFVEAGALGGKWGTATYVLETELRWKGICVEPSEEKFAELERNRKASKLDRRLLYSRSEETKEFVFFRERPAYSGISEHLRKTMKDQVASSPESVVSTKTTITLKDLLDFHHAPKVVHYVCLDTEGSEFEILRNFPFGSPYELLAVSIEGHSCDSLMLRNGYIPVRNPYHDKEYERYFLHPRIEQYGGRMTSSQEP
jgi:FkbM family methyltransferase